MVFFHDLYLGEKIAPKLEQVMKKLNSDKLVLDLYLITLSEHQDNMLEIVPQKEMLQKGYPDIDFRVVGLASGKKEAFAVVQFIIEESLDKTGSADARGYLNRRWEGQV